MGGETLVGRRDEEVARRAGGRSVRWYRFLCLREIQNDGYKPSSPRRYPPPPPPPPLLPLFLLSWFCYSLSLSLSLFFATAFSRISPSPFLQRFHHRITLLLSRIGRTQFTRCTATLISARARRALCARPVYRVCRFQDQSSRKS